MSDDALSSNDINYWAGPRSLPLWLPLADAALMQRDPSTYLAAGGRIRPLRETIARVLDDEIRLGVDRPRRSGLSQQEEARLLDHRRR